jgi:hypothetical protein
MNALLQSAKSTVAPIRRWGRASACLLTGHQHNLGAYLYSVVKKATRDKEINATGIRRFQLMSPEDWREFSAAVDRQMRLAGAEHESRHDWAENKRVYIDCEHEPMSVFMEKIRQSKAFNDTIDRIWGSKDWKISLSQIWRHRAERYGQSKREINSSYYHLDNGGYANDRLLLNLFMYLSEVKPENGPFTYYHPEQTVRINRHFIGELFRRGNLRTHELVQQIEALIPPQQLLLLPGEAAVLDNQVCLHRAGFCSSGHRDILAIDIMPKK